MKKYSHQPSVIEVYTRVVDKTVEALEKYIKRSKKTPSRFNIPQELKSRWQARLNFLFSSVEGSWLSLLESQTRIKNFSKKNKSSLLPLSFENFTIIRYLSDYFASRFRSNREIIPVFKPWLWYFVISQVAGEKVVPVQTGAISRIEELFPENNTTEFGEEKNNKHGKNIFDKYSALLDQGLNFYSNTFSNWSMLERKIKKELVGISFGLVSDSLGTDFEEELESQFSQGIDEQSPKNFILALSEKVNRRNTKWRVILKDGILHMNEKDFLFNTCKCEFFW
ncbi:hypothetical protein CMESO_83 (nucleomorph) [Chroomonas mesostigmatica CCMP1168]|uniref:Uncharacterized protein n=1 Tax=Chroomonas mesostigmatica CCMP1168 TaxID=1195612 RepID=J7G1B2_9CRYP|nr:hypothetical protein CMESO_83 [Chroomonas mesostigmatica CCMP1168]|mmetsp:Transcript_25622/g.63134  ORF Transcript_25622/g.63134 Transcript_25622/m.63134 type:complete len:281 (-) Transcript_25622:3614-4456(-)